MTVNDNNETNGQTNMSNEMTAEQTSRAESNIHNMLVSYKCHLIVEGQGYEERGYAPNHILCRINADDLAKTLKAIYDLNVLCGMECLNK